MKKKTSLNFGRFPEPETRTTLTTGSRRKAFDPWQDMVRFQQELTNMRNAEEEQNMRLLRLEFDVKKFQKNLGAEESSKVQPSSTTKYYLGQLMKLEGYTKRLKSTTENKLQTLEELKNETEEYSTAVKMENNRHVAVMTALNNDLAKNLEKLKKASSQQMEELEAILRPSSRWTIHSKSKRSLTSSQERPENDLTKESLSSISRPKTQGQEMSRVDFLEAMNTEPNLEDECEDTKSTTEPEQKEMEIGCEIAETPSLTENE